MRLSTFTGFFACLTIASCETAQKDDVLPKLSALKDQKGSALVEGVNSVAREARKISISGHVEDNSNCVTHSINQLRFELFEKNSAEILKTIDPVSYKFSFDIRLTDNQIYKARLFNIVKNQEVASQDFKAGKDDVKINFILPCRDPK